MNQVLNLRDIDSSQILGSAYLLGSSADHLNDIYEDAAENEGHEHWQDSPSEIALHDYRDYLGKREYQRAWVDFFEDQLVLYGYDWKAVVTKFLFEKGPRNAANSSPIFNSLTGGLGHPLIHLGYAYELNSKEVAMEALGLGATCYDPTLAALLESSLPHTSTANPLTYSTSNIFEVLARCNGDLRLDGTFKHYGGDNLSRLLSDPVLTAILLEHWSAWKITDPKAQFEQSQRLATALLIASAPSVGGHGYDFFLVHLLTTSHAVRILIPFLPPKYHVTLVREWWLITLAIYIAQLRPVVKLEYVRDVDLHGRDWKWVDSQALDGKHNLDAHFVKALRAMKEAAAVWGDDDQYFLKAAVKFAGEFTGWGGFGAADENEEAEKQRTRQREGFA